MNEVNELKAELASERETIEDLLNQLQTMELEGRATKEESEKREKKLVSELNIATRELEDERTIRLQQMYMLSRIKEECEIATTQLKEMQVSRDAQNKDFEKLEASLELTRKLLVDRDDDLRTTTEANLMLRTDSLHLQNRLVEADQETTQWRRKYEKLIDLGNKQQTIIKPAYSNVKNSRQPVEQKKSQKKQGDQRIDNRNSLPSVYDRSRC